MSFNSCYFSFDGISCTTYGLVIYDTQKASQSEVSLISSVSAIEDRPSSKYSALYYGANQNSPLEFNLVFGIDLAKIDSEDFLSRTDIKRISDWLIKPDKYRSLIIHQDDLSSISYKCIISELSLISTSWSPWAFSCRVHCDSQYAYQSVAPVIYNVLTEHNITIQNTSSYNGYYMPKVKITFTSGNRTVKIINQSDNNREMSFTDVYGAITSIDIDCSTGVITNNADLNIYDKFNFNFLRLKQGENSIKTIGQCSITITCEYPVSVGY